MIAAPRPPVQDELELLIKEARERQLRRRLLGAAGIAIAAALGLGVFAFLTGGTESAATTGKGRAQAAAACGAAGGWRLRLSPDWAEPTGQHTAPVVATRNGSSPCTLAGFPTIVMLDADGHRLGFRYSHRGDAVVSGRPPRAVHLVGGGSVFFLLNKYRCDVHAVSTARRLLVGLPGVRGWLRLRLPHYPILDYCPAESPSTTIAVSPIVARPGQAAARRQ